MISVLFHARAIGECLLLLVFLLSCCIVGIGVVQHIKLAVLLW